MYFVNCGIAESNAKIFIIKTLADRRTSWEKCSF